MLSQLMTNFFLLINSILISFILPLIHSSIPGGDSGELIAAIAPPRKLVQNTFKCLKSEGDSWTKFGTKTDDNKQQSSSTKCSSQSTQSSSCSSDRSNSIIDMKKRINQMAEMAKRDQDSFYGEEEDPEDLIKDSFICGACSTPSLISPTTTTTGNYDEEFLKESSSCIRPRIKQFFSPFSFFTSKLPQILQNTLEDAGVAHPPGYSLYTVLTHFLVSLTYEIWRPGAFAMMKVLNTDENNNMNNLYTDLRARIFFKNNFSSSTSLMFESVPSENHSSNANAAESLLFLNPNEAVDSEVFLLWDFILRTHFTSFLYLIFAAIIIGVSVFRFSFEVLSLRNKKSEVKDDFSPFLSFASQYMTAATASFISILTLLASSTVLRYSTEVEVFSLNFVVLALGIGCFLEVQMLRDFETLLDEKISFWKLIKALARPLIVVFSCGFVLGLVFLHQHAALFIAVPLMFGCLPKIFIFARDSRRPGTTLGLFYSAVLVGFILSISPGLYHMYLHKCVRQIDSPFGYSWNGKGDSSMIITSCPLALWKHFTRDHYGTFSMTSSSSSSNSSETSSSKLTDRFNAHLFWISSQTPNSIIFMIVGSSLHLFFKFFKNVKQASATSGNLRFILSVTFWLFLSFFSSVLGFAWFSSFDVSPKTTNGDNIFAHVHERFWTQSIVVLSVWSGIAFSSVVANYDEKATATKEEAKKQKMMVLAMIAAVFALSSSSLLSNSVIPAFSKLRNESRAPCDDCSVASSAVSLWWQQLELGSSKNSKLLLTSGDLYFGPLILLDPFLRFFQLQLSTTKNIPTLTNNFWMDLEVGSNPWFRRSLLSRRLQRLVEVYFISDTTSTTGDEHEDTKAKRSKNEKHKMTIQHFKSIEHQLTTASDQNSNTNQRGSRLDLLKLVSSRMFKKKSDSFDIFTFQLPEFTSQRPQLAKHVDFLSSGFVYHLKMKSLVNENDSQDEIKKACEKMRIIYEEAEETVICGSSIKKSLVESTISKTTVVNIFGQDIYDLSVSSGLSASCAHSIVSLYSGDTNVSTTTSSSNKRSSSTVVNKNDSTSTTTPIHLAWVTQTADQCANAGKNSLINFLTHFQSHCPAVVGQDKKKKHKNNNNNNFRGCDNNIEKKKMLQSRREKTPKWTDRAAVGLYRFLLSELEKCAKTRMKNGNNTSSSYFDVWMTHIARYVQKSERKGDQSLIGPLISVLKQVLGK